MCSSEMPKYRSHKEVYALKIAALEVHEDNSATIAPAEAGFETFTTRAAWADRFAGTEEDMGYYVVYTDGFTSWSPSEAFEAGYTRL